MLIVDCFSFCRELDLLGIRLHELYDVVDRFVLVESPITHSGHAKPLYYHENKHLFHNFRDKITHIVINLPITPEEIEKAIAPIDKLRPFDDFWIKPNWVRERVQRDAIMLGLEDADSDDIIIIGDADEIMRASVLDGIDKTLPDGINAIWQSFYSYYLNLKCINKTWRNCKIMRKKFISTPSEDRYHAPFDKYIGSGWHFNFLGGADAIREKIKSYAHSEFAVPEVLDNIEQRLIERKDVFGRDYEYKIVSIDETYPKYVLNNLEKFNHLICGG